MNKEQAIRLREGSIAISYSVGEEDMFIARLLEHTLNKKLALGFAHSFFEAVAECQQQAGSLTDSIVVPFNPDVLYREASSRLSYLASKAINAFGDVRWTL